MPEQMTKGSVKTRKDSNGARPREIRSQASHGNLTDRMIRDIVSGLYEGRYEPGQRITEAEMTATYRASRGPVREALNRLATMGIIELLPQRGARVRVLTVDEAVDTLVVVQGLVRMVARLAAERHGPEAAHRLTALMADMKSHRESSGAPDYAKLRDTFYGVLTDLAGNSELSRIFPRVQIHLIRIQFRSILRSTDNTRHADYHRIVDAIIAGKASAAEAAAKAHIGRAIQALSSHDVAQKR
jgi:DNA-binding GntR family transcriptional regulator